MMQRVRSLVGSDAVVESHADGLPLVLPSTTEACALVLEAASREGWRVRIEGARTWADHPAPADLALGTTSLSSVASVHATDLVATVEAGIRLSRLREALADQGGWLAADPPGADRTLGSAIATGTSGPLRSGFGALRDHLLGVTIVTGDGRILKPGGKVVKNVAGFDLTRLAAGSFGAFGVITSVHLRLRTVPRADVTLLATGARDDLVDAATAILAAGESPAALELLSPAASGRDAWTLAARLVGSEMAVEHSRRTLTSAAARPFNDVPGAEAFPFWQSLGERAVRRPVTLRLGTLIGGLADTLDLIAHHLDDEWTTTSAGAAAIRWSGTATAERIRLLRHAAMQRETPVTVERAPWDVLSATGHFGAFREGVGPLLASLRRVFDPKGVLVVPEGA